MRKRVAHARLVAAAGLVAMLAAIPTCDGPSSVGCPCACDQQAAPPVDASLMAFLSKARAVHHQADLEEEAGDITGAAQALEKLVNAPLPEAPRPRPEATEVLADTLARLADLRGQKGEFDAAEQDIAHGLERAPERSYFEGHLWEIRGVNEERRAKSLAEAGSPQQAERARKKAAEAFERAIAIQDQVIRDTLAKDGGR
jgi:tetratricopeptide (TPR) repeat protein